MMSKSEVVVKMKNDSDSLAIVMGNETDRFVVWFEDENVSVGTFATDDEAVAFAERHGYAW